MRDAALTHPNLICQQANALFAMGIAHAIQSGCDGKELYQHIRQWAADMPVESALLDTIDKAANEPPAEYVHQQGCGDIAMAMIAQPPPQTTPTQPTIAEPTTESLPTMLDRAIARNRTSNKPIPKPPTQPRSSP